MSESPTSGKLRALIKRPWFRALDPIVRDVVMSVARTARRGPARSLPAMDAMYRRGNSVRPVLLGHRGAMARAPENTLGAFKAAIADGGDGIELDTQLTADAIAIVLHDDTLDRTTNLTGSPIRHSVDELDDADAGTWFGSWGKEKVPRLAEVFAALPAGSIINVELKGPTPLSLGLERRVLEVIRAYPQIHTIVSSFHPAQLLALRTLAPAVPIGLLVDANSLLPLRTAWAAPLLMPDAIHPPASIVDGGFVAAAHQAGMRVHAWAVADVADAERLLDLGVDGLIVDDVRSVADAMGARGYSRSL